MKTLDEIKNEVAYKTFGVYWDSLFPYEKSDFTKEIIELYAKEVANQALIDACLNVKVMLSLNSKPTFDEIKHVISNTPILWNKD